MRFYLALIVMVAASWTPMPKVTHATWDGVRFSCPAHTDIWADESEALAGKPDYAYCVPEVRR